jgi:hypothetical protein
MLSNIISVNWKVHLTSVFWKVNKNILEIKRQDISIHNMIFELVSSFKYFGSIVNETNKIEEEIQSKIAAGNRAYHANKKLLTNKLQWNL